MGVHDPLREPGRAGGVVQLGRILGGGVGCGEGARSRAARSAGSRTSTRSTGAPSKRLRVGGVGDQHTRLGVAQPVGDPLVAVEHRHRQQDRSELPGREEDRGGLGRRRKHDRDAVAALHAEAGEQVRCLVGECLELAPVHLAHGAVGILVHHRECVGGLPSQTSAAMLYRDGTFHTCSARARS